MIEPMGVPAPVGDQIIRQPDGQYALVSSVTGTIVMWDADEDDVIEWFVEQAAADARRKARRLLDHVSAGVPEQAYHQLTLSWSEALARDREHGGEVWQQFAGQTQDLGGEGG